MPQFNKQEPNFFVRSDLKFKLSTLREEDKSVEFVLTTEFPAKVMDWERWEIVNEVLVASGVEIPSSGKIPLQDSHARDTIEANLGSVREIRVEGDQVIGRLFFDMKDEKAVKAFEKVKAGHIDSGSVGYNVTEKTRLLENETTDFNGKTYKGPLQLSKKWQLKEYSLVAIGADPYAKARSENISKEKINMEPKVQPVVDPVVAPPVGNEAQKRAEELEKKAQETLKLAERKLVDANITELCARYGLQDKTKVLIEKSASFEDAQKVVIEALAGSSEKTAISSTRMEMGATEGEKLRDQITEGLTMRGFGNFDPKEMGNFQVEQKRNPYAMKSLIEIGAEMLEKNGFSVRHLSQSEIAQVLLRKRSFHRNAVATDMTTASFSNLTENVMNKAVIGGFGAQQHVWPFLCNIGSTRDFKAASRAGLTENGDLPLKKEGAEYRESKFSDRKESGSVGTYADKTTLTEEAMINDDLSALTTIPFRKGAAAARVPETLLFAAINTPPTLNATSVAWMSTSNTNDNDLHHADGLNSSNLSDAIAAMKKCQAPVHSDETITDYLDITPQVLLTHTDYEMTAKILLQSQALPQTSMSSGVYNPLFDSNIMPKASPRLTTTTSFYLFANPRIYPVAEMLFLNGRIAPEAFLDESTNIDGMTFRVRIRVGLIILEWRTALRFRKA